MHLHTSQLSEQAVRSIRGGGMEVHAWGVNSHQDYALALRLGILRICTDQPALILTMQSEVKQ